jgi:hypothetical protein
MSTTLAGKFVAIIIHHFKGNEEAPLQEIIENIANVACATILLEKDNKKQIELRNRFIQLLFSNLERINTQPENEAQP